MVELISKVARNGHLTIPVQVRKLLHIGEGDFVKINVKGNLMVVTPAAIIDKDQAYFFSKKCQEEIKESEEAFKKGDYSTYTSVEDIKKELEND